VEVYTTEEQQVEVIKNWWKENGTSVIAGTVIGLVGLFGWRYYNEMQQNNQEAASQAYNEMTAQLAKGTTPPWSRQRASLPLTRVTPMPSWPLCNWPRLPSRRASWIWLPSS
jgi:predicted negative regulator of RcsB-dependent stress response